MRAMQHRFETHGLPLGIERYLEVFAYSMTDGVSPND